MTKAKPTKQKREVEGQKNAAVTPQKFVTIDQFNQLAEMMKEIVGVVSDIKGKIATPSEVKADKDVTKARSDNVGGTPMPQEWEDTAREIIGEAVDHCEMLQPKGGGTLFTVIIKPEFSNTSADYLERYKADRRTKDVSAEGLSGVETWCKLIRANLKRSAMK